MNNNKITISVTVQAPLQKVWEYFTSPSHVSGWAFASPDWEAIGKVNDLRIGGTFETRMQAKDGSAGFDFTGTYTKLEPMQNYEYVLTDGRTVEVTFTDTDDYVKIIETFDPEQENSAEIQRTGWQVFLDNFKKYVEGV